MLRRLLQIQRGSGAPRREAGASALIPEKLSEELRFAGERDVLERYRLWDDLAEAWYDSGLELLRFEPAEAVVRLNPRPETLWVGAVDAKAQVILKPDLDAVGLSANFGCDLRWKRV